MSLREHLINNDNSLSRFEKRVLLELSKTKAGTTLTYGELAKKSGFPNAARAVGNTMNKNPYPIIVPCHRVVASNGIGGYAKGVAMKKALLAIESVFQH